MMRWIDAPGNQAGTRAPSAAAPPAGPRGAKGGVASRPISCSPGSPLRLRSHPACFPSANQHTNLPPDANRAEKASHKIDSKNST